MLFILLGIALKRDGLKQTLMVLLLIIKRLCGGILRNHLGQFLGVVAANLGVCPIAIAEVWGAFYSLQLA